MKEEQLYQLETKIEELLRTTEKIERGIYGNGVTGLKERVKALEIKFWIFIVLTVPLVGCALKETLFG